MIISMSYLFSPLLSFLTFNINNYLHFYTSHIHSYLLILMDTCCASISYSLNRSVIKEMERFISHDHDHKASRTWIMYSIVLYIPWSVFILCHTLNEAKNAATSPTITALRTNHFPLALSLITRGYKYCTV